MSGLSREEMRALVAIQRVPEKLDAVTAAVTRLAEAVEFAVDKAPPGLTLKKAGEGQ